jgi:prepilin-type N-terminal cleavage/methylation domain-containing protein
VRGKNQVAIGLARRGGFSLLELLIALTILAIALVPVAYFYSKSLQMVEQSSIRTRALMLAYERLAELRQMPYERIRANITPSTEQLVFFDDAAYGPIDTDNADWFGYDFETAGGEWRAMFNYPLPLNYNPYQPQTQGYYTSTGGAQYTNNLPAAVSTMRSPHINFNDGGAELYYEYEPIGFYQNKVLTNNRNLASPDTSDIRMIDRRTLTAVEPSLANGLDYYRSGVEQQVENYAIYGRRTIILDVLPLPQETDPSMAAPDEYAADDDYDGWDAPDGWLNSLNPWPLAKGPDNKFQVVSDHGTRGKLIIVQVFWLPRDVDPVYVEADELNKIELKTFISASNEQSNLPASQGSISRNDYLIISPPI